MDITNILKDKIMLAVEKLENQSVYLKISKKIQLPLKSPKMKVLVSYQQMFQWF